ncbi:MAG: NADH-quinone oxidoreductase subunit F, partial [Deltaproteobacteria bacterium]|nr:NADH-quinone oxidoreductase subunit F [Deltaproteobacteria bacterium]
MITYLSLARQANIHSPEKPGKDFISFCLNPSGYDVDPDIRQHLEELHGVARRTSARYQSYITMCKGTGCVSSGEIRLKKRFDEVLKDRGLTERVRLIETGCRGFCEKGPIVSITPGEAFYCEVQEADIEELVDSHIIGGSVVERLLFATGVIKENDIAFYRKQERRVLANAGVIDPDNIDEAIASETYLGLSKALFNHSSDEVIAMVKRAGLRGRGGGGFQTGTKWELCRKSNQDPKYVICNADEGDPGAFMDRSILEADPHRLLEGMIICGYAIGSHEGHIYVRAEYPLAVKRITRAIEQAREYG